MDANVQTVLFIIRRHETTIHAIVTKAKKWPFATEVLLGRMEFVQGWVGWLSFLELSFVPFHVTSQTGIRAKGVKEM